MGVAREKLRNISRAKSIVEEGDREPVIRHVWTWPDLGVSGSASPDGKYLSFVDPGTGDLAIREIATGKQRRLTDKANDYTEYAFASRWSADSRKVAYTWVNKNNESELHEIGLNGAPARVLVGEKKGEWIEPADWSPDGNHVLAVILRRERIANLSLISVADGSIRILRNFNDREFNPDNCLISPDGLYVAYSRRSMKGDRERDVFLLPVDGSQEIPLIQHSADDYLLGWLPEGRGILFASDRAGSMDAWTMQVDKGKPQGVPALVRRNIGTVRPMGITKEGAFYYATPGSLMDIYTAVLDPKTGKVAGIPKKEPLPYEGSNMMPGWSPDGKHLVYISTRSGERKTIVCIYSAETGKVRELRFEKSFAYPRWAPDGRYLYVQASVTDGQGIYRVDVQSGDVTQFLKTVGEEYLHSIQASADQNWIVYGRDSKTVCQILRRDAKSGQEKEIDRTSFDNNTIALSPDGKHLAFLLRTESNLRVLKVMEFPDGTPKEIQRFKQSGSFIIDIAWSLDGRFIYFDNDPNDDYKWYLRRVPLEGGEAQDLGLVMRRFQQLNVHPDGQHITFASLAPEREFPEVWVMENFLPKDKR